MRAKISQREAYRLKQRVRALEEKFDDQRRGWSSDWPGSTVIARVKLCPEQYAAIDTARKLKHAVVVVAQSDYTIACFADKL